MILITVNHADGSKIDITAKDIQSLDIGFDGRIAVRLKNIQSSISSFISGIRTGKAGGENRNGNT